MLVTPERAFGFRPTPVALACAILVGLSGAAMAQEATAPAETVSATPPVNTVKVTGIRSGIEAAISIKKNATSIVEAISAEDIGKLPDSTVAESISRLPGVTTQRDKITGRATAVSVRGLSSQFNGSLLNGREQASTGDARNPEFDLFPAELTGAVLVYKTPEASLLGQGLASTIDLRTVRPLEFPKRVIAAGFRKERLAIDSGGEEGSGKRKTLSYVDQFANRTIGLSLGVTSFKQDNGEELIFDSWGAYTPTVPYNGANVVVPGGFKSDTKHSNNDRDSATATLQYRPNAKFKTSLDMFYSSGNEKTSYVGLEGAIPFGSGIYDPNGTLTDATIVNGIATSGTFDNYKGDIRNNLYSSKDKFTSFGWNTEWKVNEWRLEADLSHSVGERHSTNYETTAGQPGNTPNAQLGKISYTGFNGSNFADVKYTTSLDYTDRSIFKLTDMSGWGGGPATPQAGYAAKLNIKDKLDSLRLSGKQDLSWGPVVGANVGINFSKRDKSRLGAGEGRLAVIGDDGYAAATMPGNGTAIAGPVGIRVAQWDPTGSLGTIYSQERWVDPTVLSRDWVVTEKVTTAYMSASLDGKLLGLPYTGNVGVQVLNTQQSASGNTVDQSQCTGITVDTCKYGFETVSDSYVKLLPSLNLAFELANDRMIRIGAGKQLSRPNMDNMRNSVSFSLPAVSAPDPVTGIIPPQRLTGFVGNPKLRPYEAKSLDLSFEQYFGNKGIVSAAFFYKKIDNYVINLSQPFDFKNYVSPTTPLPTEGPYQGSTVGAATQPVNSDGGSLKGVELAASLPFSLLTPILDGFGANLNYSYSTSSVTLPTSGFITQNNSPVFVAAKQTLSLPGLSKNVASVRLYYEKKGFQVSYAIRSRSAFVGQILDYRGDPQFTNINKETIADVQGSYEFQSGYLKGLSIFVQANNLTNTPFQEYMVDPSLITIERKYGKSYNVGVTYKF
jgi:iron complex outermembrane receptor protein